MDMVMLKDFFFWGFILNFGLLLFWFLMILIAKDFVFNIHSKIFSISKEQYNVVMYSALAAYKLMTYMFFFIPWLILHCLI